MIAAPNPRLQRTRLRSPLSRKPLGGPINCWRVTMGRCLPILVLAVVLLIPATAFGQRLDPALYGVWALNVEKSDFGAGPKPKKGQVNWTAHGWVFALVTGDGRLYADGVATDHGCTLIGVPSEYSCEIKILTPRHLRLTLKQASAIRRVGDIELVDKNTTKTTHRVTPAQGAAYVEKTIWEREPEE
jgi:hypothetical protein